jgi:hypothetical protein
VKSASTDHPVGWVIEFVCGVDGRLFAKATGGRVLMSDQRGA